MKKSRAYRNYITSFAWRKKSRWVRSLTCPWWTKSKKGRCSLFPFLAAEQTHHLTYFFIFNIGWDNFGFEQPGWHLIPLSEFAHNLVSKPFLWTQPVRFFVNLYLRLSFILLWTICKPITSVPLWLSVYFVVFHSLS